MGVPTAVMEMDRTDIKELAFEDLKAVLEEMGEPAYRAGQVSAWLYKKDAARFEEMTNLGRTLREKLAGRFTVSWPELAQHLRSRDGAEKFLLRLDDGRFIETVLISGPGRATVCLSSQVGCRFACPFCGSGSSGFSRNLSAAEIVNQLLYVRRASGRPVSHAVFMGMGEPLDNFDSVGRAIGLLNAPQGVGLAARRITVSTCGLVPGIEKLMKLGLQVELSVSLHAASDDLRNRLVPVNRKYPLTKLIPALQDYNRATGRQVTLEYALMKGVNDTPEEADRLAALARRARAKVNLIPLSPTSGSGYESTPRPAAVAFLQRLEERRVRATLRRSKGGEIQAACGQLAGRLLLDK
ncbi:MAG: 23S rRNA (adenine(2503)-C(2))-methyltransferase RlmN [Candidatus Aminicenantales bacterium]